LLAPQILDVPTFLPGYIRHRLSGQPIGSDRQPSITIPYQVKRILQQPEKISVSEHARKYRVVTDGAHEGRWRHEYAPHTVKIMDTFGAPWVREVWFCGVEQSGKTNTMLNCMAWAIDCDPGNIYYLMPTEDTGAKITGGKIKPMLAKSPRLSRLVSDRQDDTSLSRIKLLNGVTIFPAHANSATAMATWAAKFCFGDEVDKYPPMAGKEADPITLIKKRNRTYKGRYKRFFSSTPAGMYIHQGMQDCHQVYEYRERCPDCGQHIRMEADNLVMPPDPTPEMIELEGCEYACNECGSLWDEAARITAIKTGGWFVTKGGNLSRPEKVGFHHRAWDCLDIGLTEIAVAYLKGKSGPMADRVAWANGYEAIDYKHERKDRAEDYILRLVDQTLPRAVVPRDTSCLMMIADTQRKGFFYQIIAYGFGQDLPVKVIDHGYVERFDGLANIANREWCDADDRPHRIAAAWIDSGGGTSDNNPKHSRTKEVYAFCKLNPVFRPLKGRQRQTQPWNSTLLEFFPSKKGSKIPIRGGLILYTINVTLYKDELATKLQVEPGDPGAITLHAEMGMDYAQQMCAEFRDDRGYWQCPRGKDNHHWDISVYALAAADIAGIRKMKQTDPSAVHQRPQAPKQRQEQPKRRRW
jgi:terminase, large subunit